MARGAAAGSATCPRPTVSIGRGQIAGCGKILALFQAMSRERSRKRLSND
jgi:hypothetical protein